MKLEKREYYMGTAMRTKGFALLLTIFILYPCPIFISASEQNKGAEDMVLKGGQRGNIAFPHARHQAALEDCNLCHHQFPQKKGSIPMLIDEGKLQKRAVMLKCQGCHRKIAKSGRKTGPISCSSCHNLPRKN